MDPRLHLLASDHRHVLEFFFLGLLDVSEPEVERQELLYNASVLAHFAQVSTQTNVELPTPATLADVFDHFVFDGSMRDDSEMMEASGTDDAFRIFVAKTVWSQVLVGLNEEMDYDNFKSKVAQHQGNDGADYEHSLHDVWSVMNRLQNKSVDERCTT